MWHRLQRRLDHPAVGTFQKFFEHEELGAWIDQALGTQSVAAGLGSYYVFREATERETYLASRASDVRCGSQAGG